VHDFCYLGSWIRTTDRDIQARIHAAFNAVDKLWRIWRSNLAPDLKRQLFKATIETVLLYGGEGWVLTVSQQRRLNGAYTRLLRKALDVPWHFHVTNAQLYASLKPPSTTIRQRRLRFTGHCFRHPDHLLASALFWSPPGTLVRGGHVRLQYPDQICADANLPQPQVQQAMLNREAWRKIIDDMV
jgi:hypothetical protein